VDKSICRLIRDITYFLNHRCIQNEYHFIYNGFKVNHYDIIKLRFRDKLVIEILLYPLLVQLIELFRL